jgi:short-subunit dehydrogenase
MSGDTQPGETAGLTGGRVSSQNSGLASQPAGSAQPAPLACITGATSGIGLGFARELAVQGYRLLLCGRRQELLQTHANELSTEYGVFVELFIGDLTDPVYRSRLIEKLEQDVPHILVNNAGFGLGGLFLDIPVEESVPMLTLHSQAPMELCAAIAPRMVTLNRGTIINVSSLATVAPVPGNAVYCGTKAFLDLFTRSLALELWNTPVKVQSLLPGFTYTDFHDRIDTFTRERKSRGLIRWQTPRQVVRASLKAGKKKLQVIPGWSNKLLFFLSGIIPRWLYYRIAAGTKI